MPYTTKKGTGKDKGKTCVHKKSSKKKVGCTSGPIEKYLTALRMAESDDMDWMKGPPSFRFGEISRDLRNYFSKGDEFFLPEIAVKNYYRKFIIILAIILVLGLIPYKSFLK